VFINRKGRPDLEKAYSCQAERMKTEAKRTLPTKEMKAITVGMETRCSSAADVQKQTYSFKFLQRSRQRGGRFKRSQASDIALNGDRLVKGLCFFGSALRVPLLLFSLLRVWKDSLLAGFCCTDSLLVNTKQ
jgi:hypothetical protein